MRSSKLLRTIAVVAALVLLRAAAWFVMIPHGLQTSGAAPGTWQGYAYAGAGIDRQAFYLRGKGLTADVWVDGLQIVHLEPPADEAVEWTPWPPGMHRIIVRTTRDSGDAQPFDAGFVMPEGAKLPFGQSAVLVRPAPLWRVTADRVMRPLIVWLDGVLLIILAWVIIRAVDFMVPPEEQ